VSRNNSRRIPTIPPMASLQLHVRRPIPPPPPPPSPIANQTQIRVIHNILPHTPQIRPTLHRHTRLSTANPLQDTRKVRGVEALYSARVDYHCPSVCFLSPAPFLPNTPLYSHQHPRIIHNPLPPLHLLLPNTLAPGAIILMGHFPRRKLRPPRSHSIRPSTPPHIQSQGGRCAQHTDDAHSKPWCCVDGVEYCVEVTSPLLSLSSLFGTDCVL